MAQPSHFTEVAAKLLKSCAKSSTECGTAQTTDKSMLQWAGPYTLGFFQRGQSLGVFHSGGHGSVVVLGG